MHTHIHSLSFSIYLSIYLSVYLSISISSLPLSDLYHFLFRVGEIVFVGDASVEVHDPWDTLPPLDVAKFSNEVNLLLDGEGVCSGKVVERIVAERVTAEGVEVPFS